MTLVLLILVVLAPAVVLHEFAHGWVANKLGDPTAKMLGRLTLNPLKHVDPVGTVLVPGLLLLYHFLGYSQGLLIFGWAKPVPVNFLNLRNPKRDMALVGIAGPAINVFMAVIFSQMLRLELDPMAHNILGLAVILNLVLAVFNMIPIPPLDGSRLMMGLLPNSLAIPYSRLEPYGILIVFGLLYLGLFRFVWPVVESLAVMLGVGA